MKLIRYTAILAVALLAGFPACSTTPSQTALTPQQAVFAAKASYEVALVAAVAYKNLPTCSKSAPPCSTPAVVAQIQLAQPAVRASLDAAESAVISGSLSPAAINSAVAAGAATLKAFEDVIATLKNKP